MSVEMLERPSAAVSPSVRAEAAGVAKLAVPIVISLAAATLIGVVDTIMIAPLGTNALAAASIVASVGMIFYAGLYGFISATSVRMASAHGSGDARALAAATRAGLRIGAAAGAGAAALMLALLPTLEWLGQPPEVAAIVGGYWAAMSVILIPYAVFYALKGLFDAIDAPWIGVALAFFAVALNVPANWVLIHGVGGWQGFGLLGAGLASLLSQTASLALGWIVLRKAAITADARGPMRLYGEERRAQWREGSAIAIGYVGEGGSFALTGLMMGWFGAQALAANQIVTSVGVVLYMVPLGVSIAVSIRVGQAIGAEARARLRRIGLAALAVIVGWMAAVMTAVLLGGGAISAALSDDAEVVALATSLFVVIAAMQIGDGVQGAMLGACRGMEDNRTPVAITLACYWLLALPAAYGLGFHTELGPPGVWIGYSAGLVVAATAITWRFFATAR
ncbi:MAG: MATE family efflux transporter [Pseudomonadota bacterium]